MEDLPRREITTALAKLRRSIGSRVYGIIGMSPRIPDDGFDVQVLNVTDSVRQSVFRPVLEQTVSSVCDDLEAVPYEPGFRPDTHQVGMMRIDSDQLIRDTAAAVIKSLTSSVVFQHSDDAIGRLKFHGYISQRGSRDPIAAIRLVSPSAELGRTRKYALLHEDGSYDQASNETLVFDERIEMIFHGDLLYVFSGTAFNRLFGQTDSEIEDISDKLEEIVAVVPIANSDEFFDACLGQSQMRTKIRSIASRGYLQQITIRHLRDAIRHLNLEIEVRGDELVFENDRSTRWLILKLLDDDYLESRMTNEQYEVNSKRRHG